MIAVANHLNMQSPFAQALDRDPDASCLHLAHAFCVAIEWAAGNCSGAELRSLVHRRTRFAVDRALSQHGPDPTTARAAARHEPGSLTLVEPMALLVPWWNMLMLDGGPPRTMCQLAAMPSMSESAIARRLDHAEAALRQAI